MRVQDIRTIPGNLIPRREEIHRARCREISRHGISCVCFLKLLKRPLRLSRELTGGRTYLLRDLPDLLLGPLEICFHRFAGSIWRTLTLTLLMRHRGTALAAKLHRIIHGCTTGTTKLCHTISSLRNH